MSTSPLAQRLITGILAAVIVIAFVVLAPPLITLLFIFCGFFIAAIEFLRMARGYAPTAPLGVLWIWLPLAAAGGALLMRPGAPPMAPPLLLTVGLALVAAASLSCLLSTAEPRDMVIGTGLIAFAIPYFTVPVLALYWLHSQDYWLVILVIAIVAIGDSAAYFVGRAFGKTLLAPRISPKKTWEGSAGGFAGSLLAAAAWSYYRLGSIDLPLMAIVIVTTAMAQLGDLVESAIKRGGGVKDSSRLLPGHGGFFDRLDATILAAPTFAAGWWLRSFL